MDEIRVGRENVEVRSRRRELADGLEKLGIEDVIRIEVGHELPGSRPVPTVSRHREPTVRPLHQPHAVPVGLQRLLEPIGRTIVRDDDLEGR